MATIPRPSASSQVDYPTRDGRPMGETEVHRDRMYDVIQVLQDFFAADPMVCVSGNLLIFYVPGDKRRHVSPDVFVVRGVPRRQRDNYLVWEEGRAPDLVIELTSRSTRKEDLVKKFELYRDVLRVAEYFLFDPKAEYLDPPLRGYRLVEGRYDRIEPTAGGRLPSAVLGLELERVGSQLRFYDPASGRHLPTPREALRESEAARQETEAARQQEAAARRKEAAARQQAEAEAQRLRQELADLRRKLTGGGE
jgi:Uma2 family endonuclease